MASSRQTMGNHKNGPRVDRIFSSDGRGEIQAELTAVWHANELPRVDEVVVVKSGEGAIDGGKVAAVWDENVREVSAERSERRAAKTSGAL